MSMDFDSRKLKELMLYVSSKCLEDKHFGATKLNKILWMCDFQAFRRLGVAITGASYQKLPHGPAPKALLPVLREMELDREAVVRGASRYGHMQKRLIPLREPDLSVFKAEEIALVDDIIEALWSMNASEVSEMSHGIGWRLARPGEEIPYSTVFISTRTATEYDIQRGQEIARERGWLVREPVAQA